MFHPDNFTITPRSSTPLHDPHTEGRTWDAHPREGRICQIRRTPSVLRFPSGSDSVLRPSCHTRQPVTRTPEPLSPQRVPALELSHYQNPLLPPRTPFHHRQFPGKERSGRGTLTRQNATQYDETLLLPRHPPLIHALSMYHRTRYPRARRASSPVPPITAGPAQAPTPLRGQGNSPWASNAYGCH